MVISCSVVGCTNRQGHQPIVSFYLIPADVERRRRWLAAINRKDWEPSKYSRICSAHFLQGQKSDDPLSPDYVPSVFAHTKSPAKRRAVKSLEKLKKPRPSKNTETMKPSDQQNKAARDHKAKEFQCKDCGKVFGRACNLVQHQYIHGEVNPFKCQYCDHSFNSVAVMRKHNRKMHADQTNHTKIKVSLGLLETHQDKTVKDETLEVEVAEEFPECEVEAVDESTNSDAKKREWVCDKCGRKFSSSSRLLTHLRFHEGKPIFNCIYCEKDFLSRDQLKMHERVHTGEKPYKCDHCPKFFSILSKLYAHTRTAHGKESADSQTKWRSYLCYVCKEEFSTKKSLVEHHASQHKKERYQCKFCQQKFIYKSLLRTHERTHYSVSEKSDLARQSNKKSYSCEYCEVDFPNRTDLQIHQLTHLTDLKYCCRYCKMSFLNENTLILHERSHTGEQPYRCDLCGRWFSLLGTLYGHIRTQHPHAELPDKSRFEDADKRQAPQPPKPPAQTSSPPTSEASSQITETSPSKLVQIVLQPTTKQSSPGSAKLPSRPTLKSSYQTTPKSSLQQTSKSLPKSLTNDSPSPHKSPKSPSKVPTQPVTNASLQTSAMPTSKETLPPHVLGSFKCDYCDRRFKRNNHLKEHLYLHIGKPHICDICGQTFTRRYRFEKHMSSHTGNDAFECDTCSYKFPSRQKLVTHTMKCHNAIMVEGDNGYKCQYCDISFTYNHNLEMHLKSHAEEVVGEMLASEKSSDSSDGEQEELTCKECGTVVRLGRTALSNVFSVTDFSNVKCLLNNHTII